MTTFTRTFHIAAIVAGLPGEIIVNAETEAAALRIAKSKLPRRLRFKDAQFNVTEIAEKAA